MLDLPRHDLFRDCVLRSGGVYGGARSFRLLLCGFAGERVQRVALIHHHNGQYVRMVPINLYEEPNSIDMRVGGLYQVEPHIVRGDVCEAALVKVRVGAPLVPSLFS